MSTLKNSHAYNATNLLAVRHISVVPQHSFIHLHSIVKLPNALMLSNWCCLGPQSSYLLLCSPSEQAPQGDFV